MVGVRQRRESNGADRGRGHHGRATRPARIPGGGDPGGRSAEDRDGLSARRDGGRHRPHMVAWTVRFFAVAVLCGPAWAETVYTYIGQITSTSVLIAWGATRGGENTIGRDSTPLGAAQVRINGQTLPTPHNWI